LTRDTLESFLLAQFR